MENFIIDPAKKTCQISKEPMNPVEQLCTNSSKFKPLHEKLFGHTSFILFSGNIDWRKISKMRKL